MLTDADADERRLMPAWRRYTGTFYQHAAAALAEAAATGNLLIVSGGYGLVRADEPIGLYNKVFKLHDWPRGLLEALLVEQARTAGMDAVVAFASTSTDYARLLRRTPCRAAGIPAYLVTAGAVGGGAMRKVPQLLGQAFTAFCTGEHDRYPAGTIVEVMA